MSEEPTREEVLFIVETAVMKLLDTLGIEQPPIDAFQVARHLNIAIREDESTARTRSRKEVVLTPQDSEDRRQWLVAQAIGMERKPLLLSSMGIDPSERRAMSGESLSNLFAEHLLLPTRWFQTDAKVSNFDLLTLKDRYRTAAYELIALRFLDLPEPCVVTILEEDRILKRRSNGPRVRKQLETVEKECQQRVIEKSESCSISRNVWTVQGWLFGSQVILRSVVEPD